MVIVLTGTRGQVGGALRPLLERRGDLVAPGRAEFDLSKPDTLAAALDGLKPDLIINPAAYTAVDRAEDEPELAHRVNAEAPAAMARWAARHRVPLVHFSTDYVFDGSGNRPWRENDPCRPLSIYGQSKRQGESGVREAGGAHLIIRTAWVFASQGGNFFRTMVRLARQRSELRVVDDQFGAPTSARSIAQAVMAILRADKSAIASGFAEAEGVVHVTSAGATSWHGFAVGIVEGLTSRGVPLAARRVIPIHTDDYPTKARRPANSQLDLSRLSEVFGLSMPTWQSALATELDAFVREESSAPPV
jgi:dTDP-4-dehydrorhamnose reductase